MQTSFYGLLKLDSGLWTGEDNMQKVVSAKKFVKDEAWAHGDNPPFKPVSGDIEGVTIESLVRHADDRGDLVELLSTRNGPITEFKHSYCVTATPMSVRAWLYHKIQVDRLNFINGLFRIVLFDIRDDSPTKGNVMDFTAGHDDPIRLIIPTWVVHGVCNIGSGNAYFINMPTEVYDLKDPDKYRLPYPNSDIPIEF